jgi:flagellar FliJ protein
VRRFRFPLEPVLAHRRRIEEDKERRLGERLRELAAARAELASLEDEYRRYAAVIRTKHRMLDAETLRAHYAHLEYLDRAIDAQLAVVRTRTAAADVARAELIEASKERKTVERLRERRYEEHVLEEGRIEQKELDDVNARRHEHAAVKGEFA